MEEGKEEAEEEEEEEEEEKEKKAGKKMRGKSLQGLTTVMATGSEWQGERQLWPHGSGSPQRSRQGGQRPK